MTAPDPVRLREALDDVRRAATAEAERVLAALRADGWELYRPEECVRLEVKGPIRIPSQAPTQFYDQQGRRFSLLGDSSLGSYRLVPVESEDRL